MQSKLIFNNVVYDLKEITTRLMLFKYCKFTVLYIERYFKCRLCFDPNSLYRIVGILFSPQYAVNAMQRQQHIQSMSALMSKALEDFLISLLIGMAESRQL
jgi:hypothetical protein